MFAYREFVNDHRQVSLSDLIDLGVPEGTVRDLLEEFDEMPPFPGSWSREADAGLTD